LIVINHVFTNVVLCNEQIYEASDNNGVIG